MNEKQITRVFLIILTILVLGPLVFAGSCLPLGYLGFIGFGTLGGTESLAYLGIYLACAIGGIIAIYVVIKVIKDINLNYK
jgi:hypothetical protein